MVLLLTMIVLAINVLSRRQSAVADTLRRNKWVWILYLYMAVSVLWSEVPLDSLKRWIRTCGDLAMALILVTDANPLVALKEMLRRSCMLLIPLSLVLSKYFPALGRFQEKDWAPDTWIGVATHKNTLGMLCLLSAFYFLAEIVGSKVINGWSWKTALRRCWVEGLFLSLSIYLLFGIGANSNSVSSTSKLCFLMSVGLLWWLQRYRGRPQRVGKYVTAGAVALVSVQLLLSVGFDSSLREVIARSQGKDPGLAERTQLWSDLYALGEKNALLGAGYASFWSSAAGDYVRTVYTWSPWQSHNGYVETFLNLGWIGVTLLVLIILSALRGSFRTCLTDYDYGLWRLVLVICCLVENYAEAGFPRPTHVLWFTFLATSLNAAPRVQVEEDEQEDGDELEELPTKFARSRDTSHPIPA
jgi:exopolysaccharide production protein ExoQ